MEDFIYKVNDKEYPVLITIKKIKNTHFRFRDGAFVISCNRWTSKRQIIAGLDKYADYLLKHAENKNLPMGEGFIYIFGVKVTLNDNKVIRFTDGSEIKYKDEASLKKELKKLLLKYITNKVGYYSKVMNLPLYKVTVRDMNTRFGSNSRYTKSLHFALKLVHFAPEIIDSVIIHELAHIPVANHSKDFYNVVYKYCPNYDIYRKKLIRGIYA